MRFSQSTLSQPYILAAFIYSGIIVGILYSFFRLVRRVLGGGRAVAAAADIFFILFASALVVWMLYSVVSMRLRGYYFVGLAIGLALYFIAISPLVECLKKKFIKKTVDKRGNSGCNSG